MNPIDILFDHLDTWRHLPNYQLERRTDIFFSLYLPKVLELRFGKEFQARMIPEFPIRQGTLEGYPDTDKSYKADYLAFSTDLELAVLVELKTEIKSLRQEQGDYLEAAVAAGMNRLLNGLIQICKATAAKEKYFCLLDELCACGIMVMGSEVVAMRKTGNFSAALQIKDGIRVLGNPRMMIAYVQPTTPPIEVISFQQFRQVVDAYPDEVSKLFAKSLDHWSTVTAGTKPQGDQE